MAYTPNLLLNVPTQGDPAYTNNWAVGVTNLDFNLLDSAISGILSLSVAGSSNVTLTSTQGAADQARNQHFILSGVLTGNIYVLWPAGLDRMFSVTNNTTGAFTLSCGVTNGSGAPVGVSVAISQGDTLMLYSNGTDVKQRAMGVLGTAGNFTVGGNLSVTGTSTLTGNTSITGTLGVASNFSINTNKFTVASSTGNSLIAGTLNVTGASTLASFLNLTTQPRFNATWASSFSATNKITGMTESVDVGGNFSSSRFTVPSGGDGDYFFYWTIQNNGSPSTLCTVQIYKNGTGVSSTGSSAIAANLGFATGHQSTILSLVATDYVEIYVVLGTCHSDGGNNVFGGMKIG